jgi:hypothetical protein
MVVEVEAGGRRVPKGTAPRLEKGEGQLPLLRQIQELPNQIPARFVFTIMRQGAVDFDTFT